MAIRPADHGIVASSLAGGFAYTTTGSPTLTEYSGYFSLTFTGSGSFAITANPAGVAVDCLSIGGGGGAGEAGGSITAPGGGGGGGAQVQTSVTTGTETFVIGVGGGGTGDYWGGYTDVSNTPITRTGGGGYASGDGAGNNSHTEEGGSGGAGSGGAGVGYSGANGRKASGDTYGGNGGNGSYGPGTAGGGGGGGADENGTNPYVYSFWLQGGMGGDGVANTYFDGTTNYYAGGGGGSTWYSASEPGSHVQGLGGQGGGGNGTKWDDQIMGTNGAANTGGGAGSDSDADKIGGSGIVIFRVVVA